MPRFSDDLLSKIAEEAGLYTPASQIVQVLRPQLSAFMKDLIRQERDAQSERDRASGMDMLSRRARADVDNPASYPSRSPHTPVTNLVRRT